MKHKKNSMKHKKKIRFVFSVTKWLVPLECCHMDWYCQKAIYCLAQSWWNTVIPVATWTDIVKRQFIVLLSPSGTLSHGLILSKGNLLPCSILRRILSPSPVKLTINISNPVTPFHITWFGTHPDELFYKLARPT